MKWIKEEIIMGKTYKTRLEERKRKANRLVKHIIIAQIKVKLIGCLMLKCY